LDFLAGDFDDRRRPFEVKPCGAAMSYLAFAHPAVETAKQDEFEVTPGAATYPFVGYIG
jgi:hypothetical protein